ncbi:hypothetical protein ACHAXT_003647 [Thalassiosira profunda]
MTASAAPSDALARLAAMRAQEEDISCYNYFVGAAAPSASKRGVDASSRAAMIDWLALLQTQCRLGSDTVWVAASYLDRYLSSGRGKSAAALQDKYQFQLAAITAFYLAVKLHEKEVDLPVALLAKIARGYYPESDILSMEEDILFALDWRMNTPTPSDFVVQLAALLPASVDGPAKQQLVEVARGHVARTAKDVYFAFCPPSVVGASCLASALAEAEAGAAGEAFAKSERQAFWLQLGRVADLIDVMEAQARLLGPAPGMASEGAAASEEAARPTRKRPLPSEAKPARLETSEATPSAASEAKPVVEIETATTHRLGSFLSQEHKEGNVSRRRPSMTSVESPVCVTQVAPQA